ncbi:MAG: Rpn family recombination-promoting nuclease/putative transposase [Paludibacteraceae bacterium]|nr:Rpn family recombination-promoting nuclease/putative transposase [Paludibacteraceae bacterium]
MGKYIDLKCDFAFKYCMQDEVIMRSFLNAILEGETDLITSVKYENVEMPRENKGERGVCFDLLCTTEKGETILVEMQNAAQRFFKTRAAFYTYSLMRRQIKRGVKWSNMKRDISRIIGIFILGECNGEFHKAITRTSEYDRDELTESWDRIHKFFISLTHFKFDKANITTKGIWMELFKNLGNMDKIDPSVYERADEGLLKLLKKAETNALTEEEYDLYEASMKRLEDEINMEQHGFERAIQLLIASGMPISEISERLNLSKDEIESLK